MARRSSDGRVSLFFNGQFLGQGKIVQEEVVTESDWLTSTDPVAMLEFLTGHNANLAEGIGGGAPVSPRKVRLINCGWVRQVWDRLDPRSRAVVEVAERFADGDASVQERRDSLYSMPACASAEWSPVQRVAIHCAFDDGWQQWQPLSEELNSRNWLGKPAKADLVREIVGNPFHPVVLPRDPDCRICDGKWRFLLGSGEDAEAIPCRCCQWLTPPVVGIARQAYDERPGKRCQKCDGVGHHWSSGPGIPLAQRTCDLCQGVGRIEDGTLCLDTLGVLADALEDAGCDNEELLMHLRTRIICGKCYKRVDHLISRQPRYYGGCAWCGSFETRPAIRVRGDWALDLILGKS